MRRRFAMVLLRLAIALYEVALRLMSLAERLCLAPPASKAGTVSPADYSAACRAVHAQGLLDPQRKSSRRASA